MMQSFAKYVPISLVIVSVVLASYMSGRPKPQQATKRFFLFMALYILVWAYWCFRVYPQYVWIE
jgi:hypothetical protein